MGGNVCLQTIVSFMLECVAVYVHIKFAISDMHLILKFA